MKATPMRLPALHQSNLLERAIFGQPVAKVLPEEIRRAQSKRIFIVSNASLAGTFALGNIASTLGDLCVGLYAGVRAHSPRACIIEGARQAMAADADLLLAVGGGSVIDAAKVMLLVMRHRYTREEDLDPHVGASWNVAALRPDDYMQWCRVMAIPTTCSAAEYTAIGGATESITLAKQPFTHQMLMPIAVINDPAMMATSPVSLLLSTGMKAIDHAAERITSTQANIFSDTVSSVALELLSSGLLTLKSGVIDSGVMAKLQYGVYLSMIGSNSGVRSNLSHAIAHSMGSMCDVPHGHTSCVLLPSVLRWIHRASEPKQSIICRALNRTGSDAGGAVAHLASALGLPATLQDVGIRRDQLATIAERTLHDPQIANCPIKIEHASQIRQVLDLAWNGIQ